MLLPQKEQSFLHLQITCANALLSTKTVEGATLPLESVDHIHGGDSLPLGMLSVGDSIPDDILQENLKNTPCLLVDEA